jgi:hypothetical protein
METREANVQFPHWLIIGGALLVFVGLIGSRSEKGKRRPTRSALNKIV